MSPRILILAAALAAPAAPAMAQEVSVPDYQGDYAQSLLNRRLSESMMDYQRRRGNTARSNTLSPSARAICIDKARVAARLGRNTPKARRLYALCAHAGY